jgi:FAD/FMN-containing dehydrogenase
VTTSNPGSASIERLAEQVTGRVITATDADYDEARQVFYGGFDRRPGAIVRAIGVEDVRTVVRFAGETGVELAIRGGGHSVAGHSTTGGGVVLDLAEMKGIEIDPEARTAWAEAGLTALEYLEAAAEHGLATGFGDTGSVGIAGLTLGGGVGYFVRKHGLTVDDLLAAEIVTADGELLEVDEERHPDLFWAIRGGGGNFGVVTRLKLRLHEVGTVYGGILLQPATAEVITGLLEACEAAPEELSAIVNVMPAMPMPGVPEENIGKLSIMTMLAYIGDPEAGERAVAPLRALAEPFADMVEATPYPKLFEEPEAPEGEPAWHPIASHRTMFVDAIGAGEAATILEHLDKGEAMMNATQLRVLGGAMARVPVDATAFAHRKSRIMVNVAAVYEDEADAAKHEAWVVELADALRGDDPGGYVNFVGDEGDAGIRQAYPGPTWDRLREIKRRYDPTNLFRLNQNIPPATDEGE